MSSVKWEFHLRLQDCGACDQNLPILLGEGILCERHILQGVYCVRDILRGVFGKGHVVRVIMWGAYGTRYIVRGIFCEGYIVRVIWQGAYHSCVYKRHNAPATSPAAMGRLSWCLPDRINRSPTTSTTALLQIFVYIFVHIQIYVYVYTHFRKPIYHPHIANIVSGWCHPDTGWTSHPPLPPLLSYI